MRIIVGAPGAKASYNDLVTNPASDIITLPDSGQDKNPLKEAAKAIVARVQKSKYFCITRSKNLKYLF